jgi:SIR2-like domain/TIR domain
MPTADNDSPGRSGGTIPAAEPTGQSLKIFISYRREDTAFPARLLYGAVAERFGPDNVFYDRQSIPGGTTFFDEITSHASEASVFIVLIGPYWMRILTEHQRNRDRDVVLHEIDQALRSPAPTVILPVLVAGTSPLKIEDLPPALQELPGFQVEYLRDDDRMPDDIRQIVTRLEEISASGPPGQKIISPPPGERVNSNGGDDTRGTAGQSPAPAPPSLPCPPDEHYREVVESADNLVICLGADANTDGYVKPWQPGSGVLPDDRDLAGYLAARLEMEEAPAHLAEAAQYVGSLWGSRRLFRWLKEALREDSEPSPIHTYLARLPAKLGNRYPMIVTPKYDQALENAFRKENQKFDRAIYVASSGPAQSGRFVHLPWDGEARDIPIANKYLDFPIEGDDPQLTHTLIVRNNGRVGDTVDTYLITEDHYINFLTGETADNVVPIQILGILRNANWLFLGYTISDWRLRMFLRWIWKGYPEPDKRWAVENEPGTLERDQWLQAGVKLYECGLGAYLQGLFDYLDRHPGEAR